MLKVDTVCMEMQVQRLQQIENQLNQILSNVDIVNRNLRWSTSISSSVCKSLVSYRNAISLLEDKSVTLEKTLLSVIRQYNQAENKAFSMKQTEGNTKSGEQIKNGNSKEPIEENGISDLISKLKVIFGWQDKANMNDGAGLLSDVFDYLGSLVNFLSGDMKGLTGAADYFNLTDSTVGLWTGGYDYLKKFYNGIGNTFSIDNQINVKGLDIAGNTFGFIGAIYGAVDTINNTEDIGAAGIIGEIIGTGDEAVEIGEGVVELLYIGENGVNITTKSGVYSALNIYGAICESGVATISQAFKSIEKYSSDGVWSLTDTAETGIDIAVAGIYELGHALTFGADDLIYGLELSGGNGNADMSYAEKAAEGLKIGARKVGEMIGNWWISQKNK